MKQVIPQQLRRTRVCAAAAVLSGAMMLAAAPADAAEIVVSWTLAHQEVRPQLAARTSAVSIRLNLQGGSTISERSQAMNTRGQTNTGNREGQFRAAMGNRGNVTWRVQNAKTLVRTSEGPQHTMTVRVSTIGENACRATVSYRLKPGFREYLLKRISNGEAMFVSSMRAEDIKCAVTN